MSIVSSTFTEGPTQPDGRKWVRELHVDQLGVQYPAEYLADDSVDRVAVMNARAAQISAELAEQEAAQLLSS